MASPLSPSLDWKLANSKWSASLNPVINNPLNNCSVLKDINLVPGTNVINHLLGKNMQGWFLVDMQTPVTPALNVFLSTPITVASGSPILYDTVIDDPFSGYDPATGIYTVPADGYYEVLITFDSTTSGVSAVLTLNGAQVNILCSIPGATTVSNGGGNVKCVKGDKLAAIVNNTVSVTGSPAPYVGMLSINTVSEGASIYRNGPFNDKTLSLFSSSQVTVSIGVF